MNEDSGFDVFIAYYGNEQRGTESQAGKLYEIVKQIRVPGNNRTCRPYFHPAIRPYGSFEETPKIVARTPLFLMVVNKGIPRDQYGQLNQWRENGTRSNLYDEAVAFRDSLMYKFLGQEAAKLYITDDFNHTSARNLFSIFTGTVALSTESGVVDWIQNYYEFSYPDVLYKRFRLLARENRDIFYKGEWVKEAETYWRFTNKEELGRCLLVFYCKRVGSDITVFERIQDIFQNLQRRIDLQSETRDALLFARRVIELVRNSR